MRSDRAVAHAEAAPSCPITTLFGLGNYLQLHSKERGHEGPRVPFAEPGYPSSGSSASRQFPLHGGEQHRAALEDGWHGRVSAVPPVHHARGAGSLSGLSSERQLPDRAGGLTVLDRPGTAQLVGREPVLDAHGERAEPLRALAVNSRRSSARVPLAPSQVRTCRSRRCGALQHTARSLHPAPRIGAYTPTRRTYPPDRSGLSLWPVTGRSGRCTSACPLRPGAGSSRNQNSFPVVPAERGFVQIRGKVLHAESLW